MPASDGLEAESAFPPWSLRICPACGEAGAAEAEAAAAAARLARRRLGRWRRPAWECHEAWRRPQRRCPGLLSAGLRDLLAGWRHFSLAVGLDEWLSVFPSSEHTKPSVESSARIRWPTFFL